MTLDQLINKATNKQNFNTINDYICFCLEYLEFIEKGLQAIVVSRNENNYIFYQYKEDANYAYSRPINKNLMLDIETFNKNCNLFLESLKNIKDLKNEPDKRILINKIVYTCQQSIGATLDALPSQKSNKARKINGDLFEKFIRMIISQIGIDVTEGNQQIPVKIDNEIQCYMNYQHDLIIKKEENLCAIGSVKTSSKDRLDKIFIDKFIYNKLSDLDIPHFAIFLNDVQRKGVQPNLGINSTFLSGHFKGYTIKLNPLDGVYYCDLRPVMEQDSLLKQTIKTFDCLIIEDIWNF